MMLHDQSKLKLGIPRSLRVNNRKLVLNLFRDIDFLDALTISKKTKISKTTVMKILDYYTGKKIIHPVGKGESTENGGKKPVIYTLNEKYAYAIAVNIFPEELYCIITDLKLTILYSVSEKLQNNESLESVIEKIDILCRNSIRTAKINKNDIIGIGIAIPGIADYNNGILRYVPRFFSWGSDINFVELLQKKIKNIPIIIDNDCRFQALAEKTVGIGKTVTHLIVVEAGVGLGAGIITENETKRGVHNIAGEVGHMVINPLSEEKCVCGGIGCFEVMVSIDRLIKKAKERYNEFPDSQIFKSGGPENILIENVFDAANNNDKFAMSVMDEIISWFAIGFSNIIVMYDPEILILHGIYTKAGNYFIENLRRKVNNLVITRIKKQVEIEFSKFGKESGVIGCVLFIFNKFFRENLS